LADRPISTDLAPSQVTASTVARPDTPPRCEPSVLTWWTAQVWPSDLAADAVLRVRNDGDAWCEVDISTSPHRSAEVEPNIWLEPGEWGDLVLGSAEPGCASASVVTLAQIDVDGAPVVVPTAAVVECGWALTAFFVEETPTGPCTVGDLTFRAADTAVVVRSSRACVLGAVVDSRGAAAATPEVAVTALAAGDVVAYPIADVGDCAGGGTAVTFDVAGPFEVGDACLSLEPGPGRPYFAGPDGPLAGIDDPAAALALLGPFS
jgi:hypothetical protein